MANTSSYPAEVQLTVTAWVHKKPHTGQTMAQVVTGFHEQFNELLP
jgi:hypothetical protein